MKGKLFFNQFKLQERRVIVLFAGDSKLGLIHTLARETVNAGYKSLVISFSPMAYPIEGEVILADSAEIILSTIEKKPAAIYYLARNSNDDLLNPLTVEQLSVLSKKTPDNTKLLIQIDSAEKKQGGNLALFPEKLVICEVNYNAIRNSFDSLAKKDKVDAIHPYEEKKHKQVHNIISKNCPLFKSLKGASEKICYIGQIKNLYDENSILPIARQIKTQYDCRVFTGYIQNYTLKET